jgi:hypothetical protein
MARFVRALLPLLLAMSSAAGAELFYLDHDAFTGKYVGPVGPLVLSGEIVAGDYDRVLAKIADDADRFLSQNKIALASTAGDVNEAIKIAALVKSLDSQVTVGPLTGRCAGACFLIYAAAGRRETDAAHLLGIVNPLQNAERASLQQSEVPKDLLDGLLGQAPNAVYWLSVQDEAMLGEKSPSFARYLVAQCALDDAVERAAIAGKRPFEDLQPMWACRSRVTQAQARKALRAALDGKPMR